MATPGTPYNFLLQQGNAQAYLSWDYSAGATGYPIQRSTDNITFSTLATATINSYLDTTVTAGVQYYYKIAASNTNGTSSYTAAQGVVPVESGNMTLGQLRYLSQSYADRINSNFVTVPEWNLYINQSYFELYDILVNKFEDSYYFADPYDFTTAGSAQFYDLPTDMYKLYGVDLGLNGSQNAWVTLKRFNYISRNRYIYPNLTSTFLGVVNLRYRQLGSKIEFIPTPSAGQTIRLWYAPKMTSLVQDIDQVDGVSGWTEYIIIDAALKAMRKEESDVTALLLAKQAIMDRIDWAASNRDQGEPDTISDTRRYTGLYGIGSPNGDSSSGGY